MQAAQKYQVAFKFQFEQDISNQAIQIDIVDTNSFLITKGEKAQLQPYLANSTPPLMSFSVSSQQLFLNISKGGEDEGMEGVVWATFTNGGGDPTLTINLAATPAINSSYTVMGTQTSGALKAGKNVISIGS
ncbi:hypothetical protein [Dyella tabacisoli]|uniref:Uncharacterized protein n=1 Tax=Dyella tabacisoli TaxID=2282381 RepID=A0A369ULF3_9GAMM|nr:hypothetical protein [Dyella tabacisoli]RDD81337.1 hypothetical protein DVJ77_13700 [Dyella tabacisoli]